MLVPMGILGILYHASPCDGGLRNPDGNIWITGDDFAMTTVDFPLVDGTGVGSHGFNGRVVESTTGGEAPTKTLRYYIHIRQLDGLEDFEVEIAMEIDLF